MFMMWVSFDLRVMWGIVVSKYLFPFLQVCISVMHFDGISQLGVYDFINIKKTPLPK